VRRWAWIVLASACSRERVEARRDADASPSAVDAAKSVVSATVSVVPSVEPPKPEPDAKWLARFDHGPDLGWGHHLETDVATTLSTLFLDTSTPDPTSATLAATVHATSLVVGHAGPTCGMIWDDAPLLAASPKARAAAHAFLVRVAAGATPSPWSNGVYAGERVVLKPSGTVPWDDGGLFGVLFRGDEVLLLRGRTLTVGDSDCPSIGEIWNKTLKRP
jgi:hypothetical protein